MRQLQNATHTAILRYGPEMQVAAARIGARKDLKILSFGCSIGDELLSLRSHFPDAELYGCDVDERALAVAQATMANDPRCTIFRSTEHSIREFGPFDLVSACSVLCRNPSPPDYSAVFPFREFERVLATLDESLNPGGLLVLVNLGYRFQDSDLIRSYRPVRADCVTSRGFVDVFYPDGSPFLRQERAFGEHLLSRHGRFDSFEDEEVADCIFEKGGRPAPVMTLRPVPDTVLPGATFVRSNLDYAPNLPALSTLEVRRRVTPYMTSTGTPAGLGVVTGWSSFSSDMINWRPYEVWCPLDAA